MKASLSMAALLLAASVPAAYSQTELAIAQHGGSNLNTSKDQQIAELKAELAMVRAELAALKGEPTPMPEPPAATTPGLEPIPITPEPAEQPAPQFSGATYTVQPGDGLMKIARITKSKASEIAAINGMTLNSVIHPGQVIKLPSSAQLTPAKDKANETLETVEAPKPSTPASYKIKDGETYYSISRRLKIPLDELMAANPKAPANRLYTGRVINLPTQGAVPAPNEVESTPKPTADATSQKASSTDAPPADDADGQDKTATTQDTPPAPTPKKKIMAISVNEEISYGDFAAKYGTSTDRLNSLNDLTLTSATILAKGSELYVPTTVASGN